MVVDGDAGIRAVAARVRPLLPRGVRRVHLAPEDDDARDAVREVELGAVPPADILRVAVGGPLHLASTAVDVQPWSPERCERLEIGFRRVRAFEVVRPVARPCGNLLVQLPKRMLVSTADRAGHDDQEVAVACGIATAERERAHEIDPDEVRVQDRLDAANEVDRRSFSSGNGVALRVLSGLCPWSPTGSDSQTRGFARVCSRLSGRGPRFSLEP